MRSPRASKQRAAIPRHIAAIAGMARRPGSVGRISHDQVTRVADPSGSKSHRPWTVVASSLIGPLSSASS
jgi:hypothetical protein